MQSGSEKLISKFRTSSEASTAQTHPGCTPAKVGPALPKTRKKPCARSVGMLRNTQLDAEFHEQVGQIVWQIILPASEEGIAKREEMLSLGIIPMAVQNLLHANSTVVAPSAGVLAGVVLHLLCCCSLRYC